MGKKSISTENKYLNSSKSQPLIISAVVTSTAVEGVSIVSTAGCSTTTKRAAKRK